MISNIVHLKIVDLKNSGMRNCEIAIELDVSRHVVASVLKRYRDRDKKKEMVWDNWTIEEKNIIKEGYKLGNHAEKIASLVNKSKLQVLVYARHHKLNFSKEPTASKKQKTLYSMNFYNAATLNKCLWMDDLNMCCGRDRIPDSRYCEEHKSQSIVPNPDSDDDLSWIKYRHYK